MELDEKLFNDPIHDQISLHPLSVKIIDTPQFQRLRNIKQLGSVCFVYPGASHSRFEHSIGTAHLARQLVCSLKIKQPNLDITNEDVLCVEIAGLCHGPFSHLFDQKFIRKMLPDREWKHETQSCMMLDYLIEDNNIWPYIAEYNLKEKDVLFVKEMIAGPLGKGDWPYIGRSKEKRFLYEIVSNERNKVDVDKWDYFARDCHYLGIKSNFNHNRFMKLVKVLPDENGEVQICARNNESYNLYEMFHTRELLHRRAYQHAVSSTIDAMICEAMVLADEHMTFIGKERCYTMSECIEDPVAYTQLSDRIFENIAYSTEQDLAPAKEILQRILKRQLYKNVGTFSVGPDQTRPPQDDVLLTEIEAIQTEKVFETDDLFVDTAIFNFGMKENKNPVDCFRFYSKDDSKVGKTLPKESVSLMLPVNFEETEIRVLYKRDDIDALESARECFKKWCVGKDIIPKVPSVRRRPQAQKLRRILNIILKLLSVLYENISI